jgi:predicted DNA-binding protein
VSAPSVTVKTRTTRRLADRLAAVAKRNRRSVAEELRIAIENHVNDAHSYEKE